MKKLTKDEIADILVQTTLDYSNCYFESIKKPLDKQLWAALHVGFIAGMKVNGYTDEYLLGALSLSQDKIEDLTKKSK